MPSQSETSVHEEVDVGISSITIQISVTILNMMEDLILNRIQHANVSHIDTMIHMRIQWLEN